MAEFWPPWRISGPTFAAVSARYRDVAWGDIKYVRLGGFVLIWGVPRKRPQC